MLKSPPNESLSTKSFRLSSEDEKMMAFIVSIYGLKGPTIAPRFAVQFTYKLTQVILDDPFLTEVVKRIYENAVLPSGARITETCSKKSGDTEGRKIGEP